MLPPAKINAHPAILSGQPAWYLFNDFVTPKILLGSIVILPT
jgi:hypothetical protein